MKISLAITSYNRYEMTVESFAQVIDDQRIDDIVILDDCSTDGSYEKLRDHFAGNKKVRAIRQAQNRGMSRNKHDAVALSKNEWVALLDSDNKIDISYLDAFYNADSPDGIFESGVIYSPEFARPAFDYRRFSGKVIHKFNTRKVINDSMGNCLLNTCNYIISRSLYLKVFEDNTEIKGTDTLWFNYLWLKAGYSIYVVPGMQYDHLVHDGSTWKEHAAYNMQMAEIINKKILALCTTSNPTN